MRLAGSTEYFIAASEAVRKLEGSLRINGHDDLAGKCMDLRAALLRIGSEELLRIRERYEEKS